MCFLKNITNIEKLIKKKKEMRKIIILIFPILLLTLACCVQEGPEETQAVSVQAVDHFSDEDDALLVRLQVINDSLAMENGLVSGTRNFRDILRGIAIIAADIKGAIAGAKLGFSVIPGFWGFVGAGVGAIVGAAIYSAMAAIQYKAPAYDSSMDMSQEKIELVMASIPTNNEFIQEQMAEYDKVVINIPAKYEEALRVGILHNLTLEMYVGTREIENLNATLPSNYKKVLRSSEFKALYNGLMETPLYAISCDSEDFGKQLESMGLERREARIIQKFIQGAENSVTDESSMNQLVNYYVDAIENDNTLSDDQKFAIYSALSTGAYSMGYWCKHYENYSDSGTSNE